LIVDDNLAVRSFLRLMLENVADFMVCGEAENGLIGIEAAKRLRPDVIILDLSMPVMNGMEAARRLKHLMPSVPIVMFTSFADVAEGALSAGADRVLSKSCSRDELVSNLQSLLRKVA
jgi:DNA-binding NarL/FixJ family response regulator